MNVRNPYSELPNPETAFWRTAVAEKGLFGITDIYKRKFRISTTDRIATAGSCFAQHIGKRLIANGFRFLDVEPPPPLLPRERWQDRGYGIYSARYGNIYTPRQLLQLYRRASGEFEPVDAEWVGRDGHGWFDAFRPTLNRDGFETLEELRWSRAYHLDRVAELFRNADVFVFTMGLTEAWVSRRDGAVYPVCPGTVAGSFDDEAYEFRNFTTREILADMEEAIRLIRSGNPEVRFILTVSPVPLVATASGQHVLTATTYSKSVLRAAAGEISAADSGTDYFPSYELATSVVSRGVLFEQNLRNVSADGVEFILKHFTDQHLQQAGHAATAAGQASASAEDAEARSLDDVACDEVLHEKFANA